jgi:hypothetical protein
MPQPPTLDQIRDHTTDTATRLTALADHIATLERDLVEARKLRDDTIREHKAADPKRSVPQIARDAGVSISTVKAVLR